MSLFRFVSCRAVPPFFFVYCGRFQSAVIMKKRYFPITLRRRLIDERPQPVPVVEVVEEPKKKSSKSNKSEE